MTDAGLERFRNLLAQLDAQYQEVAHGMRKAPEALVSRLKLKSMNSLLRETSAIMGAEAPRHCPSQFDLEDPPSVSDVSFVLAHFVHCAESMRRLLIEFDPYETKQWTWKFDRSPATAPRAPRLTA